MNKFKNLFGSCQFGPIYLHLFVCHGPEKLKITVLGDILKRKSFCFVFSFHTLNLLLCSIPLIIYFSTDKAFPVNVDRTQDISDSF